MTKYIEKFIVKNEEQGYKILKFLVKNNIPINTKKSMDNIIYTNAISNSKHEKVKDEILTYSDIRWIGIEDIEGKNEIMIIQTNNQEDFAAISKVADESKIRIVFQMLSKK